jgi:hypothetical protein
MRQNRRLLQNLMVCAAALFLVACSSPESLEATTGTNAERDLVPLVRPMPLMVMSEPLVVEFELPSPQKGGSDAMVIGLRVSGNSRLESGGIARTVARADMSVRIRLERIGGSSIRAIPLLRLEPGRDHSSDVVTVVDGHVSRAWVADMDTPSMRKAGLIEADYTRDHLEFAWTREAEPGRYRLSIQIEQVPHELRRIPSELLVAYARQPK